MEMSSMSRQMLGTVIEIKLPNANTALFGACFSEIGRIENTYSRFLQGSLLTRINSHLGAWQEAPKELIFLLKKAMELWQDTEGNFDITLKADLERLGYGNSHQLKQKRVLERLDGKAGLGIELDEKGCKVLLCKEIDFGGFGKGYAIDRLAEILDRNSVEHYYINAGGDIFAKRAEGSDPWEILLEHPDDPERAIGKIQIDGCSIAGSAPNRRKWGSGLHHLLNAKTRMPATGTKAVFSVARTGLEADAYATAVFCAGFEEGIRLSRSLPIDLLSISSTGKMYKSPGFAAEYFT